MRSSARERTRSNSAKGKRSKTRAAMIAALLVIAAIALATIAMQFVHQQETASSTIAASGESDIDAVRARLDQQVRESMMTVTVSPVCVIKENGTLDAHLVNAPDNAMPQSFTITQDDQEVYRSTPIDPGREIERIEADRFREGPALITVQGHDPKTGDPKGSPSSVEVRIVAEV